MGPILFKNDTFSQEVVASDLQTTFFDGKTVFFRFLAEIRLRTPIKSPQKASSRPKTCKFRTTCTLHKATVCRGLTALHYACRDGSALSAELARAVSESSNLGMDHVDRL